MPELYTEFLGMRARQRALDVIANNVANSATPGFKSERVLYRQVEAAVNDQTQAGSAASHIERQSSAPRAAAGTADGGSRGVLGVTVTGATNYSAGAIRQTGRPLDVALDGEGFLVVQTARGERYTRAGSLTLDAAGQLITSGGDLVVGQNGPLNVPPGEVSIGEDGTLSVNGQELGCLKVVRFADPLADLRREGASLFFAAGGEARPVDASSARVVQEAVETSNVSTVEELVTMMQINREFESLHRVMTLKLKGEDELGRI